MISRVTLMLPCLFFFTSNLTFWLYSISNFASIYYSAAKTIIMKKNNLLHYFGTIALFAVLFAGCHTATNKKNISENAQIDMRSKYDDSTLANNILPVLMPYNRLIDPAGKVISFGDPGDENH